MIIAIILLGLTAEPQPVDPPPPSAQIVEATAVKCGLKAQNLQPLEGADPPSHWTVVPNPDGSLPDSKAFDCFLRWVSEQKGLRIGFVSQGPSDGHLTAEEPSE